MFPARPSRVISLSGSLSAVHKKSTCTPVCLFKLIIHFRKRVFIMLMRYVSPVLNVKHYALHAEKNPMRMRLRHSAAGHNKQGGHLVGLVVNR